MSNSKMSFKHLFNSAAQASAFMSKLRDVLTERNDDLRTTGHSKALHALAEVADYSSWQSMEHQLNRQVFIETLMNEYGASEAYADAASLTSGGHCGQYYDPVKAARNYAAGVPSMRRLTPEEKAARVAGNDASAPAKLGERARRELELKQAAQSVLSALEDQALPQGDEDDGDIARDPALEAYGCTSSVNINVKLSPSTTLSIAVDPEDGEVIGAEIRESAFFVAHTEKVPEVLFEKIARLYENEIEGGLAELRNY